MIYLTQSIHRNAQIRGNEIATICGNREHTWSELKDRVARLAGAFQQLGVQARDRVAILALNSDRYFEYYFAVPWANACVVPLNIRWAVPENAYAIQDSQSEFILVDDAFAKMIPALQAQGVVFKSVIFCGDGPTPAGMLNYEELIQNHEPIEDSRPSNDDLSGIYYTGGTTGFSKGVMLSHTNIWSSAMASCSQLGMDSNSRALHVAPMFHMADNTMTQGGVLYGTTHIFLPMFNPVATVEAIVKHQVSHIVLVPVMIQLIVQELQKNPRDLSSLKMVLYGASPISESLLIEAFKALPHTNFLQGYGQTELSPMATILPPEYHVVEGPLAGKLKSTGRAIPCVEIQIADENGDELPRGKIGEIKVKGPNAMIGYWNKPEETAVSLRNGWVHTGDAGYMDEEGFVFLVDRVKDMIVSGGENVYSTEVENAVMKHPAVSQAVVIGIPSEQWGEQVHAEVILKEGQTATAEDIIAKTHELIANYKCPRSIHFREEPFPLSGAGKILKREVRKTYWADKERQIN